MLCCAPDHVRAVLYLSALVRRGHSACVLREAGLYSQHRGGGKRLGEIFSIIYVKLGILTLKRQSWYQMLYKSQDKVRLSSTVALSGLTYSQT